jgi:hypothetical protein
MRHYVNMVDKCLSGWGMAQGGKSRYSVECEGMEQAEKIFRAALDRPEMKRVTVSNRPPRGGRNDHVRVVKYADLGACWKGGAQ